MRKSDVWFLASWNVRSLLDVNGPIETMREGNDLVVVDEWNVDQVEAELEKYNVDVAGLQEVKWFECGVYMVVW